MAYPSRILDGDRNKFADPRDISVLREPLRSRIYTAEVDCNQAYGRVALILNSGLRTPWQQYLLRVGRVGARNAFNPAYSGYPVTALPYRSKHQQGLAADMAGSGLSWLIRYASRYGLVRTVRSENWHFEAIGAPTVRIIPFPGGSSPSPSQELFTVSQYEELKDKLDTVLGGLMKMQAQLNQDHDRLEDTTERVREMKGWVEVSTSRTRRIQDHLGIPDHD